MKWNGNWERERFDGYKMDKEAKEGAGTSTR